MTSIDYEIKTLKIMIKTYCKFHHQNKDLCSNCIELEIYALNKLSSCKYGFDKPTCSHCPSHCYTGEYKKQIKTIMRFSGPILLFTHPILTIIHVKKIRNSHSIRQ